MTRKFVSLTLFFSFLVVFSSSVILYFIPGRNAPGPWTFLGFHRGQWVDLHLTAGLLFLVFCVWHTVLNWKGLVGGLKKMVRRAQGPAWPAWLALALNLFLAAGTLGHFQPVESLLTVYNQAKKEFRANGGGPPAAAETAGPVAARPHYE